MNKWKLAGFVSILAALVIDLRPVPADACGVKLTVKTSRPRKAVARSSNPSSMLLVGTPPTRLQKDLAAAGHDVEVVPTTSAAKRQSYAVVVVESPSQVGEARSKFSDAIVVVRSDDVVADVRSVENQVARRPVGGTTGRTVVAAGPARTPTAASPASDRKVVAVASREPADSSTEPGVAKPPPTEVKPEKIATTVPKTEVKPPPPVTPTPPPAPDKPVKIATVQTPKVEQPTPTAPVHKAASSSMDLHDEVFFTLGSAKVGNKARLDKAAKWLADNTDVHVAVEGYADPTGSPDANMVLSQSRAESVRDYLVTAGVDTSRIEVQAFGDTRLKYGRTDPRNRRVSIEAKK